MDKKILIRGSDVRILIYNSESLGKVFRKRDTVFLPRNKDLFPKILENTDILPNFCSQKIELLCHSPIPYPAISNSIS